MDAADRRSAIVEAAMPLFARKGFAATTVKDIAEAAKVSEALLYKHFRSKTELYQAILEQGHREDDPLVAYLISLPPSTEHLAIAVKLFFQLSVAPSAEQQIGRDTMRRRLLLISLLDDGEFARLISERVLEFTPRIQASLDAAIAAGDARPIGLSVRETLWALYQLATMVACIERTNHHALPNPESPETDIQHLTAFALRGFGLTEEAIAAHVDVALPDFITGDRRGSLKEAS